MFSHLGMNRFTALYISCSGVGASLVTSKNSPNVKKLTITNTGSMYFNASAQPRRR